MGDDLNDRGTRDRSEISLREEHEIRYWTQTLGVSKDELECAVHEVGHSAAKVRKHLDGR